MSLIPKRGTKSALVKAWREKAETCLALSKTSRTKKEEMLFQREAFIFNRCADQLQLYVFEEENPVKKPTYKQAVEWIAHNDEPNLMKPDQMIDLISVVMIADLFGKEPKDVADDVIIARMNS